MGDYIETSAQSIIDDLDDIDELEAEVERLRKIARKAQEHTCDACDPACLGDYEECKDCSMADLIAALGITPQSDTAKEKP